MTDSTSPQKQTPKPRPLSPHLQVYKPQMTSVLSILHRITGVANGVGLLILSLWIITLAAGPDIYQKFYDVMASPIGQIALIGWSFSIFYHMFNGIRHLIWDTGRLFNINHATRAGFFVLFATAIVTTGMWVCIYNFSY